MLTIDGKNGYINRYGIIIIEPVFDHALSFRNKKALVCMKQKWGFIEHPENPENLNDIKTDKDIIINDTKPTKNKIYS